MTTPASCAVQALGQTIWYDNIRRELLRSGAIARMISDQCLAGLTSNPSIFEKAIAAGREYDEALSSARRQRPQASAQDIFYDLAIGDIREAADLFADLHRTSEGRDGWVSLEVSPDLAYDTEATIDEAEALFRRVDRPNVMIKVPATRQALRTVETLTDRGVNVNATLLFSIARYEQIADAYLLGLESRLRRGQPLHRIQSVASFFVSRVDGLVDRQLQSIIAQAEPARAARAQALLGQVAVANARLAYRRFRAIFGSERFGMLASAGAHVQRLLWASTSTKNPAYSDLLYVEPLIGADTVNTLPPETLAAFNDHGKVAQTLPADPAQAEHVLKELEALGISLDAVTRQLEEDGVAAFAASYHNLLQSIAEKTARLSGTNG